ncbi:MAG: PD-(D/E)XK nuclease family protein [Anaerolineales bacterium]
MPNLPPGFVFSQSSLQDYADCQRRFQLRYLDHLAWPAVEAAPILEKERWMKLGARFHRMVHGHLLGQDVAPMAQSEPDLARWWTQWRAHGLDDLPAQRLPEKTLSTSLAGATLVARYDLLACDAARAVIVDWKTMRRRPSDARLASSLQTRVYRYILARAGAVLRDGTPIPPEQIEMRYWFAEFPDAPARVAYDAARYAEDEAYLAGLVRAIQTQPAEAFPKTADARRCRFCQYRSLCGRGSEPGSLEDAELEWVADEAPPLTLEF